MNEESYAHILMQMKYTLVSLIYPQVTGDTPVLSHQ